MPNQQMVSKVVQKMTIYHYKSLHLIVIFYFVHNMLLQLNVYEYQLVRHLVFQVTLTEYNQQPNLFFESERF